MARARKFTDPTDIAIVEMHRRFVEVMEDMRLTEISAETKQRYLTIMTSFTEKLATPSKPLAEIVGEIMTEAAPFPVPGDATLAAPRPEQFSLVGEALPRDHRRMDYAPAQPISPPQVCPTTGVGCCAPKLKGRAIRADRSAASMAMQILNFTKRTDP